MMIKQKQFIEQIYALHDSDPELKKKGAFSIELNDAEKLNKEFYGIFHTPNIFKGARKKENLVNIRFWLADIDDGTKEQQMDLINKAKYKPSLIIETKKGYHCYWNAKDATIENYRVIEQGLIYALNADKGCKDVTRLLRCPNFLHMKDKNNPFMIKIIQKNDEVYREAEMLFGFPIPKPKHERIKYETNDKSDFLNPDNWDRIFKLNMIGEGSRNNEMCRIIFWLRDLGFCGSDIENAVLEMNNRLSNSLPQHEINFLLKGKL